MRSLKFFMLHSLRCQFTAGANLVLQNSSRYMQKVPVINNFRCNYLNINYTGKCQNGSSYRNKKYIIDTWEKNDEVRIELHVKQELHWTEMNSPNNFKCKPANTKFSRNLLSRFGDGTCGYTEGQRQGEKQGRK
jgi:hypothetical protein